LSRVCASLPAMAVIRFDWPELHGSGSEQCHLRSATQSNVGSLVGERHAGQHACANWRSLFVATLLMQTMVRLRIANMARCTFLSPPARSPETLRLFSYLLLLLPLNAVSTPSTHALASLICKSEASVNRLIAFCEQHAADLLAPHAMIIMSLQIICGCAVT